MAGHDITVDIDELDLTGVPPARRVAVAAAFERELARLVAGGGVGASRGALEDSDERPAGTVRARPDGNPVLFGEALARAVYEGLR